MMLFLLTSAIGVAEGTKYGLATTRGRRNVEARVSRKGVAVGGPLDGKILDEDCHEITAPEWNQDYSPLLFGASLRGYDGKGNYTFIKWTYSWDGSRWIGSRGPTNISQEPNGKPRGSR